LLLAIERAIEDGATRFDLLRGDESYKARLADEVVTDLEIVMPLTGKGRAYLTTRDLARRVRRRLPQRAT